MLRRFVNLKQLIPSNLQIFEVEVDGVKQMSGVQIERCRYLEESGCTGMCVNLCKFPTQTFFTEELG
jgi:hypothetical protein